MNRRIYRNPTTGSLPPPGPFLRQRASAAAATAVVRVAAATTAAVSEDALVIEEHKQKDDEEPGAAVGAKQAVRHGKTSSPKRARLHPIIRRAAHVVIDFCIADGLTVKNKVALRFAVSG